MSALLHQVFLVYNGGKAPSGSLVAVLSALLALGVGYTAQIEVHAGVEHRNCLRLLRKLVDLGLVSRRMETGSSRELGRSLRVYYALTPDGRTLAEQIMGGVSR